MSGIEIVLLALAGVGVLSIGGLGALAVAVYTVKVEVDRLGIALETDDFPEPSDEEDWKSRTL